MFKLKKEHSHLIKSGTNSACYMQGVHGCPLYGIFRVLFLPSWWWCTSRIAKFGCPRSMRIITHPLFVHNYGLTWEGSKTMLPMHGLRHILQYWVSKMPYWSCQWKKKVNLLSGRRSTEHVFWPDVLKPSRTAVNELAGSERHFWHLLRMLPPAFSLLQIPKNTCRDNACLLYHDEDIALFIHHMLKWLRPCVCSACVVMNGANVITFLLIKPPLFTEGQHLTLLGNYVLMRAVIHMWCMQHRGHNEQKADILHFIRWDIVSFQNPQSQKNSKLNTRSVTAL